MANIKLLELFEARKSAKIVLAVSVILLLVLEIAVYVAVSSQSGLKSRIVIEDPGGTKVYESSGAALSAYEKMMFENNFGPLRNYSTHVETEMVPFPLRTWVLLAIGLPMGLILLLAFLVQVWMHLLNGGHKEEGPAEGAAQRGKSTRFDSFLSASRNITVLHVGFVIVSIMLILWLVPSFLGDMAQSFMAAVRDYQWFFLGLAVFTGALLTWIIYLRYRLSKQMLLNQLEIEKYRIKEQLLLSNPSSPQLPAPNSAEVEEVAAQVLKAGESR
jgi:hypothetical protein